MTEKQQEHIGKVVEREGKKYKCEYEASAGSCIGCVAEDDHILCLDLPEALGYFGNCEWIWKEVTK